MQNLVIENIHETRNYKLLKEIYYGMLVPCFPDPEDHLTWKRMKIMAKNGIENDKENARVLVTVTKNVDEEGKEDPVSFMVGIYYRKSKTALVSFLGLKGGCKSVSTHNLHRDMRIEMKKEAAKDGNILRTIFSIVDLPEHANPKYITLPPVTRIVMMERFGATHIPIDFHYPSFENKLFPFFKAKASFKNDSALLGYEIDGKITMDDPASIKDFIDDFYASYGVDAKGVDHVVQMKAQVDTIPNDYVAKLSQLYRKKKTIEEVA